MKIDGDKATAKFEQRGEEPYDLHFAKEGGAWRIDIMPLIRSKGLR